MKYAGTYTGPSYIAHQSLPASEALPINFSSAQTDLIQESAAIAKLATTGSMVDNWGTLTFTGTSSGLNVFSIDASQLAHSYGVNIDLPAGGYAVVNVTGADSVSLPNVGFNFSAADVLWNLSGFDSISMGSFKGSILAPSADVTFAYGALDGTLIADGLSGGGQLNMDLYDHTIPTGGGATPGVPTMVPLPMSVWTGLAMMGCLGMLRMFRRKAI